jgi:hypothetical protein
MARPIDSYQHDARRRALPGIDRRVGRSTARAFAAAISALAISTLVITTSSGALDPKGTVAGNELQAGTITLSDDDGSRSLFNLENMAPNDPAIECIEIIYDGSLVPVVLSMATAAGGDLVPYLDVRIEQGSGGEFRDCSKFESGSVVYDGSLSGLVDGGSQDLLEFRNHGDRVSFRVRFVMADEQEAAGKATGIDFSWEVALP